MLNLNNKKMEEDFKRMAIVTADREERAKRILKNEAGWDGKFPIPVAYFGGAKVSELCEDFNLIHASADDQCCWVGDAVSACVLFLRGHDLVKDPEVLSKRKTFKDCTVRL